VTKYPFEVSTFIVKGSKGEILIRVKHQMSKEFSYVIICCINEKCN
jgi:hypothetical protein